MARHGSALNAPKHLKCKPIIFIPTTNIGAKIISQNLSQNLSQEVLSQDLSQEALSLDQYAHQKLPIQFSYPQAQKKPLKPISLVAGCHLYSSFEPIGVTVAESGHTIMNSTDST